MIRRDTRARIRHQRDLDRTWRQWVRRCDRPPVGTTCLLVWSDGRTTRRAVTFGDVVGPLDEEQEYCLARWLRDVLEDTDGWRVAFLMTRPGEEAIDERDLAWATSLYAAARRAVVACEVVHLCVGREVRPLPLDALPAGALDI
ncbi:hypothetical protein RB608_25770 [Nocardioides sp. LHD-245]|uniref:hypothetical protein n=1 Tax=Nocardioides sp. LHD-245 TaxID=3051387 RepID=UPI0027DF622C|nr:hypothetical protein [Nocardioides sp. LHD-245]